jgi:chromosome segregation ATPase
MIVSLVILISIALVGTLGYQRVGISWRRGGSFVTRLNAADDEDPNYVAHLPSLLKSGLSPDRPDPEIASQLRKRYKEIISVKQKAASTLKTANPELAAELEEMADEMAETSEKFAKMAENWDAWGRPDPDLPSQLRKKKYPEGDPNYEEHLPDMLKKGSDDNRPEPDLPSALRMLKYKQSAGVKKLAASEIKPMNEALAEELSEIAEEIEESHQRFVDLASAMKERAAFSDTSKSTR